LEQFIQAAELQVESVKLIRDMDTGVSRGFAFVELASGVTVQNAVDKLNGQALEGRQLIVNEARPLPPRGQQDARPDRKRGSGGGGGWGGRGRGGNGRQRY
jgi:RNA recognition motif-containing protein